MFIKQMMSIYAAITDINGINIFPLIISSHHDNACDIKDAIYCGYSGREFLFWDSHSIMSHSLIPMIKFQNSIILFDQGEREKLPYIS